MKRIFLLLLALGALSSCSKDAAQTPGTTDGRIRIVAGVAETRAVTDASTGLTGASFVVKEGGATAPASFAGGTVYTGDVAATTGEVTFTSTPAPAYNLSDANAWFVAYAPGGTLTGDAIEWTIDGKTDIMVTNSVWDAGKYTAPITTGLNFNHQLSQVEVICQGVSGVTAPVIEAVWGKITKIEFVGAPEKMKYDLSATPAVSVSGSANLPLLADYDGTAFTDMAIPANGSTTVNAVAMVAPVAATATESFKLKVTTSGAAATPTKPIELVLPVSLGSSQTSMTAGRRHKVTLTFQADALTIEATFSTVEDWTAGGTSDNEIEVPVAPPVVGDYVYSDGSYSRELTRASKTVIGVIFWVNRDDPTNFKVCSLDEPDDNWSGSGNLNSKVKWSKENFTTGASDQNDGAKNMAAVKAYNPGLANYPAFGWCDSKNKDGQSGWYLPAPSELQYLWCACNGRDPVAWDTGTNAGASPAASAQTAWNNRLKAVAGGVSFNFGDFVYYSSMEYPLSTAGNVVVMVFNDGTTRTFNKTQDSYVRCIREFPGTPPPIVGDYYYSDGTFSTELDTSKTPVGMVFWVDETVTEKPFRYKVHSLDEPPADWNGGTNAAGNLQWSTESVTTNATDVDEGMTNMATIKLFNPSLAKYPAFKWCDDKNTGGQSGWYLPAKSELQYLWCAYNGKAPVKWNSGSAPTEASANTLVQTAWNDRLKAASVGGTPFGASIYWSATENSDSSDYSWYVAFGFGNTYGNSKPSSSQVRCVREN